MTDTERAELQGRILQELENGKGEEAACTAAKACFSTHCRWKKGYPEYAAKVEAAKENRIPLVEDSLFEAARSGNVKACETILFNMAKDRWVNTARIEVEHSGKVEITGLGDLKTLTDEQLVKLAGQLTVIGQASDDDSDTGTGTDAR